MGSERPILFNAEMVRAVLDGRKTQTRRVVKVPRRGAFVLLDHGKGYWPYASDDGESALCDDGNEHPIACPYGVPGDRLWVRETWAAHPLDERSDPPPRLLFRADGQNWWAWPRTETTTDWERGRPQDDCPNWTPKRWRPSIHMPRWASRILLEVTDVRVERVQDISHADAEAEGCEGHDGLDGSPGSGQDPVGEFADLWDSIRGDGAWERNEWVWVVSFKRRPPESSS